MERQDEPAVRGLIPGTLVERRHAKATHALHSVRAHLGAVRASLDRAYASMGQAWDTALELSIEHGAEHYAEIVSEANTAWELVSEITKKTQDETLEIAVIITDLMCKIRAIEQGRV